MTIKFTKKTFMTRSKACTPSVRAVANLKKVLHTHAACLRECRAGTPRKWSKPEFWAAFPIFRSKTTIKSTKKPFLTGSQAYSPLVRPFPSRKNIRYHIFHNIHLNNIYRVSHSGNLWTNVGNCSKYKARVLKNSSGNAHARVENLLW